MVRIQEGKARKNKKKLRGTYRTGGKKQHQPSPASEKFEIRSVYQSGERHGYPSGGITIGCPSTTKLIIRVRGGKR